MKYKKFFALAFVLLMAVCPRVGELFHPANEEKIVVGWKGEVGGDSKILYSGCSVTLISHDFTLELLFRSVRGIIDFLPKRFIRRRTVPLSSLKKLKRTMPSWSAIRDTPIHQAI